MSNEKIEAFWVNATAFDVARVMAGETVEARFRDNGLPLWSYQTLSGWQTTGVRPLWHSSDGFAWARCQVYREHSWWTERPDPGPGFRLLGKFPDEELKPGDEAWDVWNDKQWRMSDSANGRLPQGRDIWYRRRIEPEPKFAVGQTVKVVGPKVKPAKDWGKEMDRHVGLAGVIRSIPILEGEGTFYNLEGIGIWCFREDYLEPVEPVESKPLLIRRWTVDPGDEIKLPNGRMLVISKDGFEVTQ